MRKKANEEDNNCIIDALFKIIKEKGKNCTKEELKSYIVNHPECTWKNMKENDIQKLASKITKRGPVVGMDLGIL